jgi:RimJ/RimL family protein N-acetyltransferase
LTITVRTATPADADALARLHQRSADAGFTRILPAGDRAPGGRSDLVAEWAALLRPEPDPARITFVADTGTRVVGVLTATVDSADPTVGRVARLYVDPDYWNSRAAASLLSTCISHLRDAHCHVARAWVMEPNVRAQHVVEHLGARRTGVRQSTCEGAAAAGTAIEDLEYELRLDPPGAR